MGIFDKVKGLFRKHDTEVEEGIDKAAAVADDKVGDQVGSEKIDQAAEHAKDAADEIADS